MAIQNQQPLVIQPGVGGTPRRSRIVAPSAINVRLLWGQARKTLKGQFVVLAVGNSILALLLSLIVSQALQRASNDLDTINTGSIPSVDAAQAMAQYSEDIDAKAADYLATGALSATVSCVLVGSNGSSVNVGALTVHNCDDRNIDAEIILANQQLFEAAHNVTYPGERTAIERITAGFEEYVADITVMRHEYAQAKSVMDTQDVHLQSAYQEYLAASDVLHQRISRTPLKNVDGTFDLDEPNAPTCAINGRVLNAQTWALGSVEDAITCLNAINKDHLDAAYSDTMSFLNTSTDIALACCILFWLLLMFTTWRMMATTHRIINSGLTLALLTSLVFGITILSFFGGMSGRHGAFGQMVKDDYDSIYAAALLKRYGTAANGDESRWLIAQAFGNQQEIEHWSQDWQTNTQQVMTLIKQAQANRTWPEEDQPLADIQSSWNNYYAIDGQIRQKAQDKTDVNRVLDAETLSTGDSNRTFDTFSSAVDQLSKANSNHYQTTYADTQGRLSLYITLSLTLFPLMGLVAIWGVTRRLKDF